MANLILKPSTGGVLKIQNQDGTVDALSVSTAGNLTAAGTLAVTGNTTLSGTANNLGTVTAGSIAGGSITSATTFPAGHVLQMKVRNLPASGGSISQSTSSFVGVSQTDITISRTSGTQLLCTLSGGGGYTNGTGVTLRTLAKRTSGSSFSGTEVALGDSTQGNSRLYAGASTLLVPFSSVAIDATSLSGNYTYRWFYTGEGSLVNFTSGDRGDITITIMEFKHS